MKRTNKNPVVQTKNIIQKPKAIEKPNMVDIKPVIIGHQKTSHKLSKTVTQAEKVSLGGFGKSCSNFYIVIQRKMKIC